MAHAAHCTPVSLDPTANPKCYSCHIDQDVGHLMCQCPTCCEFICDDSLECDGRCRCELMRKFKSINSENVALFGVIPLAFIKDESSRYVAVGDGYAQQFDAQIGYTDHALFSKRVADRIRAEDLEILDTGKPTERVNEIGTDHGTQYWMVQKSLMLAKGKRFITGTCRDITALVNKAGKMV